MNIIPKVVQGTALHASVPFRFLVLSYMLANCYKVEEENAVYCIDDPDVVVRKFKATPASVVEEALQDLVNEGHIQFVPEDGETYILLATVSENSVTLLGRANFDTEELKARLLQSATNYIDGAYGVGRTIAKKLKEDAEELVDRPIETFTIKEFGTLFTLAISIFYQETQRNLLTKEWGQLKSLRSSYDNVTLFNLIIHYISTAKKYPTMGYLCTCRDALLSEMSGKLKPIDSKADMRKEMHSEF